MKWYENIIKILIRKKKSLIRGINVKKKKIMKNIKKKKKGEEKEWLRKV